LWKVGGTGCLLLGSLIPKEKKLVKAKLVSGRSTFMERSLGAWVSLTTKSKKKKAEGREW